MAAISWLFVLGWNHCRNFHLLGSPLEKSARGSSFSHRNYGWGWHSRSLVPCVSCCGGSFSSWLPTSYSYCNCYFCRTLRFHSSSSSIETTSRFPRHHLNLRGPEQGLANCDNSRSIRLHQPVNVQCLGMPSALLCRCFGIYLPLCAPDLGSFSLRGQRKY